MAERKDVRSIVIHKGCARTLLSLGKAVSYLVGLTECSKADIGIIKDIMTEAQYLECHLPGDAEQHLNTLISEAQEMLDRHSAGTADPLISTRAPLEESFNLLADAIFERKAPSS